MSNFSSLEVEDIHCVHFNIIDVDFGIRAIVNLGKKRHNAQGLASALGLVPMDLTQLVLEENTPTTSLCGFQSMACHQNNFNALLSPLK